MACRLIYLEMYEKKTIVGQVSKCNLKLLLKLAIRGLVGWCCCVGGFVGGMPKRNWYLAHKG